MSPRKVEAGMSGTAEWKPTSLQLDLLRFLNFRGEASWEEVSARLELTARGPRSDRTVKSLLGRLLLAVSPSARMRLTDAGRMLVEAGCVLHRSHVPSRDASGSCARCGRRLASSAGPRTVEDVRARLAGSAADLDALLATSRAAEDRAGVADFTRAVSQIRAALGTLDARLASTPAGGDVESHHAASIRLARSVAGAGALSEPLEREVGRLTEAGWRLVAGPLPWRARHLGSGEEKSADSLRALADAVVGRRHE